MKLLEDYIIKYGDTPNDNVLKVDYFLNHQIDTHLMMEMAKEFKAYFEDRHITKIVTIETSGIAPSVFLGYLLNVPVVFMKKNASRIMVDDNYHTQVHSFTKNVDYDLIVSKKYMTKEDRILFIDDFMANGEACLGALRLIEEAGATMCGVGIVIEKAFQNGRHKVEDLGYDVYSLARVQSLKKGAIEFCEEVNCIQK